MKLLLPLALTEPRAFTDAVQAFADRIGAEVFALHVTAPIPGAPYGLTEGALGFEGSPYVLYDPTLQRDLERAEGAAFHFFLTERFPRPVRAALRTGMAAETILADADTLRPDFIALGHRRHGFLDRLLAGSVTRAVLERARCPVVSFPIADA